MRQPALLLLLGIAALSPAGAGAVAAEGDPTFAADTVEVEGVIPRSCVQVDVPIFTTFFVAGCTSSTGLCTRGTIGSEEAHAWHTKTRAAVWLEGTTNFVDETLQPGADPNTLLYTGLLTITTRSGTLTIHDSGVVDERTGRYFEFDQIVSGTGKYEGAVGLLASQGLMTATGFKGTLTGAFCTDRPAK